MKKVLLSLASAVLLLSSCSSDDNIQTDTDAKTGDLVTKINFDGLTPKAASSTAIPVTSWDNVNKIQLFLYKADGTVAFSDVLDPSTVSDKVFTWKNVPEGTYELALVANIKSDEDNVATSLNGGTDWVKLEQYNVMNKKLNSEVFIDLKKLSSFPLLTDHTFEPTDVPYAPASEIFTAYTSGVTIVKGEKKDMTSTPLQLKREISLMRVRIDKTNKPESAPALSTVDFDHDKNYITVENLPVGIGLKVGSFAGGIYTTASDANRIMIGGTGKDSYNDQNPDIADYKPNLIVDANFTLWKDIRVLPNATKADAIAPADDAAAERRYVITITGWAPKDYEYADGTIAQNAQPVYWSGTVKGVFSPNIIREVNMNILSKGLPYKPKPQPEGELHIKVEAPENWNENIESESIDV